MSSVAYDTDVIAWANQQAQYLRQGRFELLDLENIAEEIEDVGKSEQRELEGRMAVLLAHLLKWQFQAGRRGSSWETTIRTQRNMIERRLRKTPSLKASLSDFDWWAGAWDDAVDTASKETGLNNFPEVCPWTREQVLSVDFFPETSN
jgi:Domain of unknown function DUF29